ncbi:hypothetical protein RJ640_005817 [Escallonia rubra]|uniref:RNase H type-1 domain-containing protein n=1 Tax=Escallonia rubra TaxID=112253 RepID=A0AA88RFY7_9ASTE|nr:hypothetical protein RJ640_005817 [Escallonia rubra]
MRCGAGRSVAKGTKGSMARWGFWATWRVGGSGVGVQSSGSWDIQSEEDSGEDSINCHFNRSRNISPPVSPTTETRLPVEDINQKFQQLQTAINAFSWPSTGTSASTLYVDVTAILEVLKSLLSHRLSDVLADEDALSKMNDLIETLADNTYALNNKAVKGQALVDFLANHPSDDNEKRITYVGIAAWKMMFDGSKTNQGVGAGIVLISLIENIHQLVFQIEKDCSNNQAEYDALIIGIEILLDMHVTTIQIFEYSQLVIKQVNGEFKCSAPGLEMYFSIASYLLTQFDNVTITHVPRIDNRSANLMAQLASGLKVPYGVNEQWVKVCWHQYFLKWHVDMWHDDNHKEVH